MKSIRKIIGLFVGLSVFYTSSIDANPAPYSPQINSAERAMFLNMMRRIAVHELGAPIELTVREMRVSGNFAFVRVEPKRPGGRPIDMRRTPRVRRHGIMTLEAFDCCHTEALFERQANQWRVVESSVGSTDLWYVSLCKRVPVGLIDDCKYEK